jgi:hypothetical protein
MYVIVHKPFLLFYLPIPLPHIYSKCQQRIRMDIFHKLVSRVYLDKHRAYMSHPVTHRSILLSLSLFLFISLCVTDAHPPYITLETPLLSLCRGIRFILLLHLCLNSSLLYYRIVLLLSIIIPISQLCITEGA